MIHRFESKGCVARAREETDRRTITASFTLAGKELVRRAPKPTQGTMIYGLMSLRRDKLHLIHESIRKLAEIVKADNVKATFFFDKE